MESPVEYRDKQEFGKGGTTTLECQKNQIVHADQELNQKEAAVLSLAPPVSDSELGVSANAVHISKNGHSGPVEEPALPRIGKITVPRLQHQDSDSSSSSSGSGKEYFTFRSVHGSIHRSAAYNDEDDEIDTPRTRRRLVKEKSKEYPLCLYPEDLDPSQIVSPSKRKAFEKRLQRLQVTTSPITRPRSTTPINVVTLDEYVISSPDQSPASPAQDKLKITLPADEFSAKPRSPRRLHKTEVVDDSCFLFSEDILFSHTRSAVVVDGAGQVPVSPRRVLIPPTLSPSSSPKLARSSKFLSGENIPQLVYIRDEISEDIFGKPAAKQPCENWAVFAEFEQVLVESLSVGSSDFESSLEVDQADADEILTVNIINTVETHKPVNIQVILSAASSSSPSPSTPDVDEVGQNINMQDQVMPTLQSQDGRGEEVDSPQVLPLEILRNPEQESVGECDVLANIHSQ